MKIHCPHCLEETELENSVADSVVRCLACKAVFDPRKKDTLPQASAAEARPELLPGICAGDGFGGYVLEKKLGKGGMGIVFAATQLSLGRRVAIKVLAHDLLKDPEFVQRFDREARVLASLNHPNIVKVIDKGIAPAPREPVSDPLALPRELHGNVYLVMEYVDGLSLRDVLSEKKLPPSDALKVIPQLCDALEYAHARGVIHRDIKPENILLDRDGGVKIADFGLARIVGETGVGRITRTNAVMGSLDYMAPEQREHTKEADHRADIYALGVVFYEMLTGELPIGRFEPPSKKVKLDVDIDEVVLRVLSKDPEARYQRASEVGAEIRRRTSGVSVAPGAAAAAEAGDENPEIAEVEHDLERVRQTGPRTAGGRTLAKLLHDVGHADTNGRVLALVLLTCFFWLFLILAAIESFIESHRAEERKRLERVAREKRLAERRRREREARLGLPVSEKARQGVQLALVATVIGLCLVVVSGILRSTIPRVDLVLVPLTATLGSGLIVAEIFAAVLSTIGLAEALFGKSRGAGLGFVGILLSIVGILEAVALFRLLRF